MNALILLSGNTLRNRTIGKKITQETQNRKGTGEMIVRSETNTLAHVDTETHTLAHTDQEPHPPKQGFTASETSLSTS